MTLKIALAQTNFLVGDIAANVENILQVAKQARDQFGADLAVFPELTVTGYPAEDLLLGPDFVESANNAVGKVATLLPKDIAVVIGFPEQEGGKLYNSAALLCQGRVMASYRKRALPNYDVFDEERYFTAGDKPCVIEFEVTKIGLTICEDIWHPGLATDMCEGRCAPRSCKSAPLRWRGLSASTGVPPSPQGRVRRRESNGLLRNTESVATVLRAIGQMPPSPQGRSPMAHDWRETTTLSTARSATPSVTVTAVWVNGLEEVRVEATCHRHGEVTAVGWGWDDLGIEPALAAGESNGG